MPENGANAPEKTLRCGNTEASMWRKDGEFGPMYSVKFSKTYSEGGEQKRTPYFGASDLKDLARLIPEAGEYISNMRKEYKDANPQSANNEG